MKIIISALLAMCLLLFTNSICVQENSQKVNEHFLGYGWIIGISDDIIFVPKKNRTEFPTILSFFNSNYKYGYRINSYFGPDKGLENRVAVEIEWVKGGFDNMRIVPVMAYYELGDKSPLRINGHIYSHLGKMDTTIYQTVSNFYFEFEYLDPSK